MILPACVLNRYPGRWLITLETATGGEIMEYATGRGTARRPAHHRDSVLRQREGLSAATTLRYAG